jgi:hypothetical protein
MNPPDSFMNDVMDLLQDVNKNKFKLIYYNISYQNF